MARPASNLRPCRKINYCPPCKPPPSTPCLPSNIPTSPLHPPFLPTDSHGVHPNEQWTALPGACRFTRCNELADVGSSLRLQSGGMCEDCMTCHINGVGVSTMELPCTSRFIYEEQNTAHENTGPGVQNPVHKTKQFMWIKGEHGKDGPPYSARHCTPGDMVQGIRIAIAQIAGTVPLLYPAICGPTM